jgi:hypothetical protein
MLGLADAAHAWPNKAISVARYELLKQEHRPRQTSRIRKAWCVVDKNKPCSKHGALARAPWARTASFWIILFAGAQESSSVCM